MSLQLKGIKKGYPDFEIMEKRVKDLLHPILLQKYEKRIVTELSGGEQQRVALAHAQAPNPHILLLDEPLSALDARLRKDLRKKIKRIQRELKITTVYVTHDQEEALAMSDKIVVMNNGHVEQTGTSYDIYNRPNNRFVAKFMGITNIIKARVTGTDGDLIRLESCEGRFIVRFPEKLPHGSDVVLFVRPENCVLKKDGVKMNTFTGKITNCEYLGDSTVVELRSKNSIFTAKISDTAKCTVGEDVSVSFLPEDCWILEDTNTNVKKCIQPVGGERSEAL